MKFRVSIPKNENEANQIVNIQTNQTDTQIANESTVE